MAPSPSIARVSNNLRWLRLAMHAVGAASTHGIELAARAARSAENCGAVLHGNKGANPSDLAARPGILSGTAFAPCARVAVNLRRSTTLDSAADAAIGR